MKMMKSLVALATLSAAVVALSPAAEAATASANATVKIVPAIAIVKTRDLDFGNVAPSNTSGTVVLTPAGARSGTGGVGLSSVDTGNQATFTVSGDSGATYAITLPSSVTLTNLLGDPLSLLNTMTVDTFTSNPSGTGTLTGGSQALNVGATLHVNAAQASGTYAGTFSVTVDYN